MFRTVTASRAVSNRESRYPQQGEERRKEERKTKTKKKRKNKEKGGKRVGKKKWKKGKEGGGVWDCPISYIYHRTDELLCSIIFGKWILNLRGENAEASCEAFGTCHLMRHLKGSPPE